MRKLQQLKEELRDPPPERVAKIEYKSHFMQILGTMIVCAILIYKGLWYIIFAFIFSIGVSYSQGINAYKRYRIIAGAREGDYDPKLDKSPTRRRDFIIKKILGKYIWIIAAIISFFITYKFLSLDKWFMKFAFAMVLFFNFLIIYFFLFYFVANTFYKRMKGGGQNGKNKEGKERAE